ncbi:hypothetical protein ACFELO_03310 [Oceanicaulis sp. LC35]|uniref:hypothetical protein n=1 Tax=Oceanicaulis sp. LC35 TaxID=3349635 RepID=UPI003F87B878
MTDPAPEVQEDKTPSKPGGLPIGLLIGVVLGFALGLLRGDVASGAGLAVAFGICFWILSPLVRKILDPKTSDDAAEDSDSASSQEKDSK